ncbi:hypothetical protein HZZ00_34975 [Streptomyces sp. NEAU-sy36]|uniref:hypothetical protein n=1 Tax=unclassified Streptomyces TaxID=2593676 RepID=UPI0015D5ABB2|nr:MULTISPECIES: hypothetical protein [unclassified Streptomyces]QLJ05715.1 hypothetical protein HZZ00_34975 [Streptomyces sp. NEAU-sy36]
MPLFKRDWSRTPLGPMSGSPDCDDCGGDYENYAAKDEVWYGLARARSNTVLCIPCLEKRIGRRLTAADLKPEATANDPHSTQFRHTDVFRDRARGWQYKPY